MHKLKSPCLVHELLHIYTKEEQKEANILKNGSKLWNYHWLFKYGYISNIINKEPYSKHTLSSERLIGDYKLENK